MSHKFFTLYVWVYTVNLMKLDRGKTPEVGLRKKNVFNLRKMNPKNEKNYFYSNEWVHQETL